MSDPNPQQHDDDRREEEEYFAGALTDPFFTPPPGWGQSPWRWRLPLLALGLLLLGAVGLRLYVNSNAMRSLLREKVEGQLQERLGEGSVGETFYVDWFGRLTFGPLVIPSPDPADTAPVVKVGAIVVRAKWSSLLSGRPEVAEVHFRDIEVNTGYRGAALRALGDRVRERQRERAEARAAAGTPESKGPRVPLPELTFEGLAVNALWEEAGEGLDAVVHKVGPLRGKFSYQKVESEHRVEFDAKLPKGGRGTVLARWVPDERYGVRIFAQDVHVSELPEAFRAERPSADEYGMDLRPKPPLLPASGLLTVDLQVAAEPGFDTGAAAVAVYVKDLFLVGDRLASEPVGPWRLRAGGNLRWNRPEQKVTVDGGYVDLGDERKLRINYEGEVSLADSYFFATAHVSDLDYQAAVDSLPPMLVPGKGAPRFVGPMTASVRMGGPLRDKSIWDVEAKLDLSRLKDAPPTDGLIDFRGPFTHIPLESKREQGIVLGPQNPNFIPLAQMPAYLYRAVTTSEDAGFFSHRGFDFQEMKASLVKAAEEGKVTRGASTITQQLAKNLFLSRERTYARKIREALITIALEANLSKKRLMEIYLNIIEWGPNLYGIGEAARHYFGKDARSLTVKEAAFLATIIPNPVRYHSFYERDALTPQWDQKLRFLLQRMRDAGWISWSQYEEAIAEPLVFHHD
jgi:monofunctional biosynthetic peptidoglycan transglycosylase